MRDNRFMNMNTSRTFSVTVIAIAILVVGALLIVDANHNKQSTFEPGVGGGPATTVIEPSDSPSPIPSATSTPTISPTENPTPTVSYSVTSSPTP